MAKSTSKRRRIGRPRGSGTGRTTRSYKICLPFDVADWVDAQPNKSAAIANAVRVYLAAVKNNSCP